MKEFLSYSIQQIGLYALINIRKSIVLFGCCLIGSFSYAQNYVRVEVPRTPVSNEDVISTLGENEKNVVYRYSDGAGRPSLVVNAASGQNGEDIVSYHWYDSEGRESTSYLPYAIDAQNPGEYRINPGSEQALFYGNQINIAQDTHPYSISDYDNYGRIKSTVAPGEAWHAADKKSEMNYFMYESSMNGTVDEVKRWVLGVDGKPKVVSSYSSNQLTVNEVISPDGRKMQKISNGLGQEVASRKWDGSSWNTVYQVYDEYTRLRFVIPPKVANKESLTDAEIAGFLFEQLHDERGRVIGTRSPGAGWNYMVYDNWNRPVMMRHEEQKNDAGNETWTFLKYDIFGRSIIKGVIVSSKTRSELQSMISGGRYEDVHSDAIGYTLNQSFPDLSASDFDDYELHSISYYDSYEFLNYSGWDAESHDFSPSVPVGFSRESVLPDGYTLLTSDYTITPSEANDQFVYEPGVRVTIPANVSPGPDFKLRIAKSNSTAVLGMATGSKVRVLGTDKWLNSVVYYDDKLREIQLITENHLSGTDRLSYEMDWEGKVLKSMLEHQGTENVSMLSEYEYDPKGQHLRTYETIDGVNRTLVAEYNYNVLGQLVEKNIHSMDNGGSFLQSVDYRYNIRGWIASINNSKLDDGESDLFGQEFNYTNSITINGQTIAPNYDGNITSTSWKSTNITPNHTPSDGPQSGEESIYGYSYTTLSQLSGASYATKNGSFWNGDPEMYGMTAGYDANGSTEQLTRNGAEGLLDDLDFNYESSSNKLTAVADNSANAEGMEDYYPGTDYTYDDMGNRKSDLNKQITDIRYNHLQLVDQITFYDNTSIKYGYDAGGNKLSKTVVAGSGQEIAKVDYVGAVEYLDNEINQVFIEGGRAYKQNGQYFNEYFITDNQGNNRVGFGVLPERNVYTATMEQERSGYEESEFSFPSNIRSSNTNHTPLGSESVALNGALAGKEVGPAKVLNIQSGDEVDMSVWARYDFSNWNNTSILNIATIVAASLGGASAGTGGEGAAPALSGALENPVAGGLFVNGQNQQPNAYLQYLFFDASYNFVPEGSGFVEVGTDAAGDYAKLSSGRLTYDEPGYLFVYVANESNQDAYVYFDDLKIVHSSASASFKVSQVNEFYPYGLHTDKSWRAAGYVDPGLMYQASYARYDSLSGYYDFLFRNYDPALGQFFAVDPLASTQAGYSPYHANYNDPINFTDPLGLSPWPHKDSNPKSGGGEEPDLGSWINVQLGAGFSNASVGAQYSNFIGRTNSSHIGQQAYSNSTIDDFISGLKDGIHNFRYEDGEWIGYDYQEDFGAKSIGWGALSGFGMVEGGGITTYRYWTPDGGSFYLEGGTWKSNPSLAHRRQQKRGNWIQTFISSEYLKSFELAYPTQFGTLKASQSVKYNFVGGNLLDISASNSEPSVKPKGPSVDFGFLKSEIDLIGLNFSLGLSFGDIAVSGKVGLDGISQTISQKFGDIVVTQGLSFENSRLHKQIIIGSALVGAGVATVVTAPEAIPFVAPRAIQAWQGLRAIPALIP